MTVLVAIDGVLKSKTTMIPEGRYLLEAFLNAKQRVVFLSNEDEARTDHWLLQNGIKGHAGSLCPSVGLGDGQSLRERQIEVARALGRVEMVVDADPEVIKHCLEIGVCGLLFANPTTSLPQFRPDGLRRTWDEIEALIDKKMEKAVNDGEQR